MLPQEGKVRFREVLRHLRGNLSQEEFSKKLNIGQSTLSGWENLKIDSPRLDHVERIAAEAGMIYKSSSSPLHFEDWGRKSNEQQNSRSRFQRFP